ncbi:hypothetical protein J2W30_003761 [Variovorax boronicumulans]|uniref:DUF3829 domain-containing protein n=1 Tax=Variovorax boronicumulans TaxID=436515 RepID=UPI00277E54F0|nr:DUF3829 domain-containing protein [Variovorax boronicumulans]MDQ0035988.1 hypothetical protein [Variovorax boronicumulans]
MKYQILLGATLVAISALVAACGDKADKTSQGQATVAAKQSSDEQQLVEKYNIYVDVSNTLSTSFQEARENYVENQVPLLKAKAPLTSLRIQNDILVDRSAKRLDAAVAIAAPLPEIDESAKAFSAALKVLSPLSRELNDYANSKGYLADNGEKARQLSADYLTALTTVAEAEAAFDKGLGARDQALTKEAFEKAPKDTAAYYRAGLIYHGKVNHADASALFAAPNDPKALAAFEASLALVADSAAGWSKKMAEQSTQSGKSCSGGMLQINEFIGQSRSMVKDIKAGVFARKETGAMARMPAHMRSSSIVSSANRYNQNFANMIGQFNHPLC